MKVKKALNFNSNILSFNKFFKKRMFEILSPEEYMFNSKNSKSDRSIKKAKLNPIIPSKIYHY
jgi:hypothetical protein